MLRNFTLRIGLAFLTLFLLMLSTTSVYPSEVRNEQNNGNSDNNGSNAALLSAKTNVFPEDFEGEIFPPDGWTMYSLLDDSLNWELNPWSNHTPGGSKSAYHNLTSQAESVDNWFVTPQVSIGSDGVHHLSFWSFLGSSWSYKKNSVLVSTGSPNPADGDYVELWSGISNDGWIWAHFFVDLQDYIGQDIYIAFRYEGDTWGHTWSIDDIDLIDDSPIISLNPIEVNLTVGVNGMGSKTLQISNDGILNLTFTTEVEYLNGDAWLTVDPLNGTITSQSMIETTIDFDATGLAFGTYQANLNITSNDPANPTATVLVTLNVINVNVYPFVEDFEGENFLPIGWTRFNVDGDENEWTQSYYNNTPGGQYSAYHGYSEAQDGWLVTPQITVPTEGFFYLSFWSMVGDAEYYGKNSVLISTGSGNPSDGEFVEVWTPETVAEGWAQFFINIEQFAGEDIYIAFRYEGEWAHYWVVDDISIGEEIDDSPVMSLSTLEVFQTTAVDGSGSKAFMVKNDGILNLTFDIEIEFTDGDGWLTADPITGSIPAKSNQTISLAFNATGLELGTYQANINITSNDPENPTATVVATMEVREAQPVNLTVVYPEYTFPTAISSNGMYVSGSQFGGMESYLWTMFQGNTDFAGDAQGVSDNGKAVGTYDTEFMHEGTEVSTAGIWNPNTKQWEFLGMNPDVPEFFGSFYNTGYGITADGSTVVGMQWYPDWSVKAIKWTQEDGYQTLSPDFTANTRANGISANGSVIYGWAEPNWIRTAAIWYNDEMIFIDETLYGEAWGASPSGNFVTGGIGSKGFIWSPTEGITLFENTLNMGTVNPTTILDDGTVFGYTGEGFPPTPDLRRAFVRHPDGSMETFNDYVANRGWFDAADWMFFSVNDVTPDGNKFIGAAELPGGEWISFMLDLSPGSPSIVIAPMQISEMVDWGGSSSQTINVSNTGTGILGFNATVQYTAGEPKVQVVPQGENFKSGALKLSTKTTDGGNCSKVEPNRSQTLHYDGENLDAIGLTAGGSFYVASRFPSEMVAAFENYMLQSVDVYVGGLPTSLKLVIWSPGTTTAPGEIVLQQTVEPTGSSWNRVTLETPIEVTGADLWVGFATTHEAGIYVMGIDAGPANMNGNWLSQNGTDWEHLSDYGLSSNWNIRANLSFNGMDWLSLSSNAGVADEGLASDMDVLFDATGLQQGVYHANIRFTSNDAENPLVIVPVTLEVGPAPMSNLYLMANPAEWGTVFGEGTYAAGTIVEISAVPNTGYRFVNWTNEAQVQVSTQPTFNHTMSINDITLMANFEVITSADNPTLSGVSLYPNPASTSLRISTSNQIVKVMVMNLLGQTVLTKSVASNHVELDVNSLSEGTYLVQITTTIGQTVHRVQVKR
jgi:hypothetical protein